MQLWQLIDSTQQRRCVWKRGRKGQGREEKEAEGEVEAEAEAEAEAERDSGQEGQMRRRKLEAKCNSMPYPTAEVGHGLCPRFHASTGSTTMGICGETIFYRGDP
jgi:hypothetical protein